MSSTIYLPSEVSERIVDIHNARFREPERIPVYLTVDWMADFVEEELTDD